MGLIQILNRLHEKYVLGFNREDEEEEFMKKEMEKDENMKVAYNNRNLGRLFVEFNPKKDYFFAQKSRLYNKEEIAKILYNNKYGNSLEECLKKTEEIIKEKRLEFSAITPTDTSRVFAVDIIPYRSNFDTRYMFKGIIYGSIPGGGFL